MSFIYQHWNKLLDNTKYGMKLCFGLPNLCTTMFTHHCWYNNQKISKILVFKVIRYHHELPCTLNSVVFELSFCLLILEAIMMTLRVHSFGVLWIMISDPRSLTCVVHERNQWIRGQRGFIISFDVPWWILIQITPEKCTVYLYWTFCEIKLPGKIINLNGLKIISNVYRHYSTYDLLRNGKMWTIMVYELLWTWAKVPIVQFQKISILTPQKGLEFPKGWGVL